MGKDMIYKKQKKFISHHTCDITDKLPIDFLLKTICEI